MKRTFSLLLILLCAQIAACSPAVEAAAPKTPQALQPTAVSTALFEIVKPDGSVLGVTVADLKTLPLAQVTVDGKVEEGPMLKDVLAFAGITEFTSIQLTGSSNPATLTREQVDDNTVLDFTNHGTVKLSTTYLPKSDWTKDVSRIEVQE